MIDYYNSYFYYKQKEGVMMTYEEFTNYDFFSFRWNYKIKYIGFSWNNFRTKQEEVFKHYFTSHGKMFVAKVIFKDRQVQELTIEEVKKALIHKKYNTSHTYCRDLNYGLNTDNFTYDIEEFYELLIGREIGESNDGKAAFRVEYFVRKMQQAWTSNYEFVDCINHTLKQVRG
jgi:hypothetical protein